MNKLIKYHSLVLLCLCLGFQTPIFSQVADTTLAKQQFEAGLQLEKDRKMKEAIVAFEQASLIFEKHQLWAKWLNTADRIGVNYALLGNFDKTLATIDHALAIGTNKVGQHNFYIYQLQLNRGKTLFQKGQQKEAFQHVSNLSIEVEEHFDKNHKIFRQAYDLLAFFCKKSNQYEKALDYDLKTLQLTQAIYGEEDLNTASSYNNVGATYIFLKNYEEALKHYLISLDLRLKLLKDKNHPKFAIIYTGIGICYTEMGKRVEAEMYFLKAYDIHQKTYGTVHPQIADFLWNLASFYDYGKDYDKALNCIKQELAIREELNYNQVSLSKNYKRLGNTYKRMYDFKEALAAYHKAQQLISQNYSSTNPYQNPSDSQLPLKNDALVLAVNKTEIFYHLAKSDQHNVVLMQAGLETANLALKLWKDVRNQMEGQKKAKQKYSYYTRNAVQYGSLLAHQLFEMTDEQRFANQAFELAEQGKSLLLQEAFLVADAKKNAKLPLTVIEKEKELSQQLANYESQLLTATKKRDSASIANLKNNLIFDKKLAYERFIKTLEQEYPEYYNLKYNAQTATILDLKQLLGLDELFVEYLIHQESQEMLIFVLERGQDLSVYRRALPEEMTKNTRKFNQLLKSYLLNRKDKKQQFVQLSKTFYQLLIEPIEKHLTTKSKMVVVGEDFTHQIPFELLLSKATESNFSDMDFLIKKLEIAYQYSGTQFAQVCRKKQQFDNDLLAFAPVFESEKPDLLALRNVQNAVDTTFRSVDLDGNFVPLRHSAEEVQQINTLFQKQGFHKNQVLLKKQATEAALKKALQKNYRFVHLASHSFSNFKQPELSGIACLSTNKNDKENGVLFSGEIYNMEINSDLVVLSSCESGLGKLVVGEGMMGINRGFVYAGVPNVLFSLWKVYDDVTSEMMKKFYTKVLAGQSYSAALREAKLQMLQQEETASPSFWGAFLLIGK